MGEVNTDRNAGVVFMAPVPLDWSLEIPDGFLRQTENNPFEAAASNHSAWVGVPNMSNEVYGKSEPAGTVWMDPDASIQSHHTLNPLLAEFKRSSQCFDGIIETERWLVFPMGIAVVVLDYSFLRSSTLGFKNPDEAGLWSWWTGFCEVHSFDTKSRLHSAAQGATSSLNDIGESFSSWSVFQETRRDGVLPWIHRAGWIVDSASSDRDVVVRSGSSFLSTNSSGSPESSIGFVVSSIHTLALGQALWYFEDLADSEAILRARRSSALDRISDDKVSLELDWIQSVRSVPGLVASVSTSFPSGPLDIWKQIRTSWEIPLLESVLEEKVSEYREFLAAQSRRNQAARERTAELILAIVAISALASLVGDLASQMTDDPVEFLGVSSTRLPVIFLMVLVLGFAYLLIKRSDS